jgi:hypothetical protein
MSQGFVYVATGERYTKEVLLSVTSLKRVMPDARVCVFTDRKLASPHFDEQVLLDEPHFSFADKIQMGRSPFERTIFLDTDTYVCDDVRDMFGLLDTHDIAVKHDHFPGWYYTLPGVPHSFVESNTGVIVFRQSERLQQFFRKWREHYFELLRSARIETDQPSFRQALFHSDLRCAVLPSEYHFHTGEVGFLFWKVKLLHGWDDLPALARRVNRELGPRVWDPAVGVMAAQFNGWSKELRKWLGINRQFLGEFGRLVLEKLRLRRRPDRDRILDARLRRELG